MEFICSNSKHVYKQQSIIMSNKINLEEEFDSEVSDSEDELTPHQKKLLQKVKRSGQDEDSSNESVLGFESEEEKGSEAEEDDRAWGKKKQTFYNAEVIDNDYQLTERQEEIANLEQVEVLKLQKQLANELNDADFSLDTFFDSKEKESKPDRKDQEKVKLLKADVSDLSQKKKLSVFKNDSPEFSHLVAEFEKSFEDCLKNLIPFDSVEKPFKNFIECRKNLIYNYCLNISYYLLLKSKKIPVKNHPVLKRIVQFKQLLSQLDQNYQEILEKIRDLNDARKTLQNKQKKLLAVLENPKKKINEDAANEVPEDSMELEEPTEESQANAKEELAKRKITYQIAKNKGLTVQKRRELRNPRVKNKMKFKKANMRRRGAIPPMRDQKKLYDGEQTGIKAYMKRSVTLK